MNNDVIKLLPDSVANQIAAGEVIQRPASVIKELVENAVDAGATSIQIILKDAGRTLIQIIDNGCGMSTTDARLAFERHATSKIRKADDLFTLHTMGFRGEALPSIAAVSEIEMRTMRLGDQLGTKIIIKASTVESQTPEVCNPGTNIMVKHLFYNFVARRRFLKKDSIELSHIMHEFERLALINTDIEFDISHNGSLVHRLVKAPLQQRIGNLFGKTVERQIIPIQTETTLVKISGFIGLPQGARHRNFLQYFFVNGRHMRHPYFHKAVLSCYKELIAADVQPNYFIKFEVEPNRIDVNIHPQKHEIKFEDEQLVWQILTAAVKESLGKYDVGPGLDFDAHDVPDIPALVEGNIPTETPYESDDVNYNPFDDYDLSKPGTDGAFDEFGGPVQSSQPSVARSFPSRLNAVTSGQRPSALNRDWEKLYESFKNDSAKSVETSESAEIDSQLFGGDGDQSAPDVNVLSAQTLFQFKNRFIVTDSKSGLMIIDQHRAHIRVLYEQFVQKVETENFSTQHLMFADSIEVDAAQHAVIEASTDLLTSLGYELSYLGNLTWAINGVPEEVGKADPKNCLRDIVADLAETGKDVETSRREKIALSMAKAAAIKIGQPLTREEMEHLISELFRLGSSKYTPDGQVIIYIIPTEKVVSFFNK